MKQFSQSQLKTQIGVTLLEVMLVLAIAAMIIVMSIRYYQSANSGQQTNSVLVQVQAIVSSSDQLVQSTGSYIAALGDDPAKVLQPLLPAHAFITPWGTAIGVAVVNASSYKITLSGTPAGVCPLVKSMLQSNNHFVFDAASATCGKAAADLGFTYVNNV